MNLWRLTFALFISGLGMMRGAETPALLKGAMEKWMSATEEWAFTQRVRTYDDDKLKIERLERYDPSRPDNQRWELLEIDGKPPTAEQREYWQNRKNRKPHRRSEKATEEYFDFEHATIAKETPETVCFELPLRKDATWLASLEKITIQLTVNKKTQAIEQVTAGLREPMKIALGLAKVTDIDLDVRFDPIVNDLSNPEAPGHVTGTIHVVVFKFGDRAEYAWSDFRRVSPASGPRAGGRAKT